MKFCLLTRKDLTPTVKSVVKVFLYDEPMTKKLGITEPEFKKFATIACKKCIKEKLSFICKNKSEVAGFCLNEDLITDNSAFSKITKKMNPIFSILEKLDSDYLEKKNKEKNNFFHLFMAGTLQEYRNKGIIKKLIQKSLTSAKKKKYKIVLTEATNAKSQQLLKKFNFREIDKINYSNFKFRNKYIFNDIGEKNCKLMKVDL